MDVTKRWLNIRNLISIWNLLLKRLQPLQQLLKFTEASFFF